IQGCWTRRGNGNDMVDVKFRFLARLGKPAIFAALLCSLDDLTPHPCWDGHRVSCDRSRCLRFSTAGMKEVPPNPPNLQPPIFRLRLVFVHCPAYRAILE